MRRDACRAPSASPEDGRTIASALAEARIGGDFWNQPAALRECRWLVRADSLALARTALARMAGGPVLIWLSAGTESATAATARVTHDGLVLTGNQDCWALLPGVEGVLAREDDEVALLAAAAGKPVFDPDSGRRTDAAALLARLARTVATWDYADPYSGAPIAVPEWIAILGAWRTTIDGNRRIGALAGITRWKRRTLHQFLWSDQPPTILHTGRLLPRERAVAFWPSRAPRHLERRAAEQGVPTARVEDGFVRSIGLGAALHLPQSIVLDGTGIYYDPSRPSDLERILSETRFDAQLLDRATALADRLVQGGVTKYAARRAATAPALPPTRRLVLVAGQVEDDLSVHLGSAGVRGNLDLLRRARAAEPDAWIAYRPHPDVAAGLRKGHIAPARALEHADAILDAGALADLLDRVDCVHVLTSLTGFEALLRRREVVTHGQPFYAGWGLTTDLAPPIARRGRRLSLAELAAGTLILYPRYLDPATGLPCPPEILIARHAQAPDARPKLVNRLRTLQGRTTLAGRRLVGAMA